MQYVVLIHVGILQLNMVYYTKPPIGKISAAESEFYCLKRIALLHNFYKNKKVPVVT